jgi:hypothetical protein
VEQPSGFLPLQEDFGKSHLLKSFAIYWLIKHIGGNFKQTDALGSRTRAAETSAAISLDLMATGGCTPVPTTLESLTV